MTDDFSNDINTTGLISVGETINGTIKNYSDSDWIKVSLEAGKEYVLKQTNNTGYVQISIFIITMDPLLLISTVVQVHIFLKKRVSTS